MAKLLRKVLIVPAEQSPNVKRELMRQRGEPETSWPAETPGVLTYEQYQARLAMWDPIRICIGISAQFYEGADSLLYPPQWLNDSARRALQLTIRERREGPGTGHEPPFIRRARGMGIDPGEGGDADRLGTAWCVVDELGILELLEQRTTDTAVITNVTKMLIRKWRLDPTRVCFDRGGGGKQHADKMRSEGFQVKTVGFGEPPTSDPKLGRTRLTEQIDQKEDRYAYLSKRAQMYHELRLALDPAMHPDPFAIPAAYTKLRQELAPIPLQYDKEGRVVLPSKHRVGKRGAGQDKTLTELIGHSPDLSDALVLAYHAMKLGDAPKPRAGALRERDPEEHFR